MRVSDFAMFPTGNLCNAHTRVRAMAAAIKPLIRGRRIAGRALTVRVTPGQNGAIHRAVHNAAPGDLLVVEGGASERFGPFGDLLAEGCIAKGLVGAVFDCTIRDSFDIATLGFQVFSRGFHPDATAKDDRGETDVALLMGGVTINPGDIVVGDDDGVVVIPRALAREVFEKASEVAAREEATRARIRAGETTLEIFGLDP